MSWDADSRTVANLLGGLVKATRTAGGLLVHIDVSVQTVAWPRQERGPVSLVPQPAEVVATTTRGNLSMGIAHPSPDKVLAPGGCTVNETIRYNLPLSMTALAELESARDGGPLGLTIGLVAHPHFIRREPGHSEGIWVYPAREQLTIRVPKEDWVAMLRDVSYCDTLITELKLPTDGPESTAPGRQRLVRAVDARNEGSYMEAMSRCRIALDEIKKAGFGGKAPQQVVKFLQEKAGTLSHSERLTALQVALQLFLSPAHHANALEEHYTREDAELAIAMTAAILRLAPQMTPAQPTASETVALTDGTSAAHKTKQGNEIQ